MVELTEKCPIPLLFGCGDPEAQVNDPVPTKPGLHEEKKENANTDPVSTSSPNTQAKDSPPPTPPSSISLIVYLL